MLNWIKKKINKEEEKDSNLPLEETNKSQEAEDLITSSENSEDNQNIFEEQTQEKKEEREEDFQEPIEKKSLFQKLKSGLSKTRNEMEHKFNQVLGFYVQIDDEMMEDLEDILISSDMGMSTTMEVIDRLKEEIVNQKVKDPNKVKPLLQEVISNIMEENNPDNTLSLEPSPAVLLVIGVNGVGKTTTIGKLCYQLKNQGKSVLVAAADTFRAAAIDQLKTWGDRAGVDVIAHSEGSDPGAVVFDGIQAAKARKADVLICDTAGRLHNKSNLMRELEKISKIIEREFPNATKETLLVLDATTGQNAIIQAKTFDEVTDISGIALTKLDGTAKGGVIVALQRELNIPIKLVGVGEGIEDLQPFVTKDFVSALFE
ncbi:MAG: signal recognition particle-docking protein FtsY [Tissierellia bacterium]|nr:signal recognition particle-docking protein FtsY [Tissierellia bacterium]